MHICYTYVYHVNYVNYVDYVRFITAGEESEGASISGGSMAGSLAEGMLPDLRPSGTSAAGSRKLQRPATASSSRPQGGSGSYHDGTDNESLSLHAASPSSTRSRRPLTADCKIGSKYMQIKRGQVYAVA